MDLVTPSQNGPLLEVFSVSHDLMQEFHDSPVKQGNSVDKNHQNINFGLVLVSGRIVTHRISGKLDLPDIRLSGKFAIRYIPSKDQDMRVA